MPDMTTAKRLSVYYDELIAAGFAADFARDAALRAVPADLLDVDIQPDLEDRPLKVGGVVVDIVPRIDPESLARVRDEIEFRLKSGVNEVLAASADENVLTEEQVREIRDKYGARDV